MKQGVIAMMGVISIIVVLFIVGLVYALATGYGGIYGITNDPNALTTKHCSVTISNPLVGKPVISQYTCKDTHEICLNTIPRTLSINTLFSEDITVKLVGYDANGGVQSESINDNVYIGESTTKELDMCSRSKQGGIILTSKQRGKLDARDLTFE